MSHNHTSWEKNMPHILVIESDDLLRNSLIWMLEDEECRTIGTANMSGAKLVMSKNHFDLIISDLYLFEKGREWIPDMLHEFPDDVPRFFIMAYPDRDANSIARRAFGKRFFNVPEDVMRLRDSIVAMFCPVMA